MPDYQRAIIGALLGELLATFAPALIAADAVCQSAARNPGLANAQRLLAAWLADLQHGEHADALEPGRLSAALRALLVRALSRGSVRAAGHPDHDGPVMMLAAEDLAMLELVRELAATLDEAFGTATVADFDAYREDTLDRIFAMAAAAGRAQH